MKLDPVVDVVVVLVVLVVLVGVVADAELDVVVGEFDVVVGAGDTIEGEVVVALVVVAGDEVLADVLLDCG